MARRGRVPKPEEERFWAKVDFNGPGGCWLWIGNFNKGGYGGFSIGSRYEGTRRDVRAHRWAYEHLVGPIPDGMEIDHLCRVPGCVNPDHLEPVLHAENMRRYGIRRRADQDADQPPLGGTLAGDPF